MFRRATIILLAILAPLHVYGDPAPATPDLCRPAIAAAEQAHAIPSHLLAAIARVESGRKDPATGKMNPWPWTINFDGQGSFYDVKQQAVAAATAMRPRAVRSIDVGCMQISLTNHPDAFASMDQAFDPVANADYGARFLRQLYDKTQSWPKAVGMYHSATAELATDYQARVYAAWPEELQNGPARPMFAAMSPFGSVWNHAPVHAFVPAGPRIIPLGAGGSGSVMQGRSLDSYRAMPVRLASRLP
jgi:hypothetical protein